MFPKLMFVMVFALPMKGLLQAQDPPTTGQVVASNPVIFTRLIKKTVAFISTTCANQSGSIDGTGFFVTKPDSRISSRLDSYDSFGYLVTNRHVARPVIKDGSDCQIVSQTILVNSKKANPLNGARNISFLVKTPWFYSEDSSVDLAVMPFLPDAETFDVQAVPVGLFATSDVLEKENVAEGDQVLYTGYFYQFPGRVHTEPIIRQGIIAMMPDEPIPTTLGTLGKGYLADAHVFGGNSGSPMFVNVGGLRNGNMSGAKYLLLGIVSGLEYEDTEVTLHPVTTSGTIGANSGVSFIVPADQILDLINSPALALLRDQQIKARSQTKRQH